MKLIVDKNQLNMAPEQFLRKAGYNYIRDNRRGQDSHARRLGRGFYPRFHMYMEENESQIVFKLHIDQKQPSYSGTHAHNAEYDGEVIESEISRFRQLLISI